MKSKYRILFLLVSMILFCCCSGQENPAQSHAEEFIIEHEQDEGANHPDNPAVYADGMMPDDFNNTIWTEDGAEGDIKIEQMKQAGFYVLW